MLPSQGRGRRFEPGLPLKMTQQEILQKTREYVKEKLSGEGTGHDWFHIERVVHNALNIAEGEKNVDIFLVELGALLHDIADSKFYPEGEDEKRIREWLESLDVEKKIIDEVVHIVQSVSFKGGKNPVQPNTIEAKTVQDADRLDALGAIGIARAFTYGGHKGRPLYDPEIKPIEYEDTASYRKSDAPTINHFYEKILKLKGLMNTENGKEMALGRHKFIEEYLKHFYSEWEGKE